MGIIRQGILGGFRKKVGNVAGAFWRDLNIIKTLPRPSNKPPTQAQIEQRIRFGLVTSYLSVLSDLIDGCYQSGGSLSPMNEAVSYHLKNAVTGTAPNFKMDFTKLRFSTGKLSNPSFVDVVPDAGAIIDFAWSEDGADSKYKDETDMLNVMVYNETKERQIVMLAVAQRSELEFSLQLPPNFVGDKVHCYYCFSSVKKKKLNSKSVYLKLITVV